RRAVFRAGRAGVALVAALGLLLLAAGLLAGSATASVELGRTARSRSWAARAELETQRAIGLVLQGWDATLDSLPIGASVDRVVEPSAPSGPPVIVRARVRRLSARTFAAVVTARVGVSGQAGARRARLLLQREASDSGSAAAAGVSTVPRWSVVDLR
ncbi:MAG TPA: hypothetical protein VFN38_08470, partial [Gemmatimonadaceae bacterium]|nr:hypothetical protein [Gemmatimonadaceae bacterium]